MCCECARDLAAKGAEQEPTADAVRQGVRAALDGKAGDTWEDVVRRVLKTVQSTASPNVPGPPATSIKQSFLLTVAARNLRGFLAKASFASAVDRAAALECFEVLLAAAQSEQGATSAEQKRESLPALPAFPPLYSGPETGHVAVRRDADLIAWAEDYGRACADAWGVQLKGEGE